MVTYNVGFINIDGNRMKLSSMLKKEIRQRKK